MRVLEAIRRLGDDVHPSHRLTLACGFLHLAVCGAMAVWTGTVLLWFVVGMPALLVPALICVRHADAPVARLSVAAGFMILTGLIIQQSGGNIEAHFSFFVMTSILVVYCDWRPLVLALALIILHHVVFSFLTPVALGVYIWTDDQSVWTHVAVHAVAASTQVAALCYVAAMLRQRQVLQAENAALGRVLRLASEQANRDPLTGLFNRNHLNAITTTASGAATVQAAGNGAGAAHCIAVCIFDIDHFKSVNDRLGHAAGDDVIRAVAQTLSMMIGPDDCAVRHGGEEFVVILRRRHVDECRYVCEAIRSRIALRPVESCVGPVTVAVSAGITEWKTGESFDIAFQRADRGLYHAKNAGRNRISFGFDAPSQIKLAGA